MADPKHITGDDYVYVLDENGHRIIRIAELMESFTGGGSASFAIGSVLQALEHPGPGWLEASGDVFDRSSYPELAALYPESGWDSEIIEGPATHGFSFIFNTGSSLLALPYGDDYEFNRYSTGDLYRSVDHGQTWQKQQGCLAGMVSFSSSFTKSDDTGRILLVDRNGFGVQYSDDDGVTWSVGGALPWGSDFTQYGGNYDTWCKWTPFRNFVAVRFNNPGRIATSPDGETWTEITLTSPADLSKYGYGIEFINYGEDSKFYFQPRNSIDKPLRFDAWDLSIGYEQQTATNAMVPNLWGVGFGAVSEAFQAAISADSVKDIISIDHISDGFPRTYVTGLNPFGYNAVLPTYQGVVAIGELGPHAYYAKATSDGVNWRSYKLVEIPGITQQMAYSNYCSFGAGIIMAAGLNSSNQILRLYPNAAKFNIDYIPSQNGVKSYIYTGVLL